MEIEHCLFRLPFDGPSVKRNNGDMYDFMPGGSLSQGVGPLYSFEPFESRVCGKYEKGKSLIC
jgi:hypothetical protein